MVRGFDSFKSWFKGYEEQYVIIGGTACDILMAEENMDFRATKDIDLVLILEAMTTDFGTRFWNYIVEGRYQHCNKGTGTPQFYRFSKPKSNDFPAMIELFSRRSDVIQHFVERMKEETVDLEQLGIVGRKKEDILEELSKIYISK